MKKLTILTVLAWSLSTAAWAAQIRIERELALEPADGSYSAYLYFDETAPGVPGDDPGGRGCGLRVESQSPTLPAGDYEIAHDDQLEPGDWDVRWYRTWSTASGATTISVGCKAGERVMNAYANALMKGYASIR